MMSNESAQTDGAKSIRNGRKAKPVIGPLAIGAAVWAAIASIMYGVAEVAHDPATRQMLRETGAVAAIAIGALAGFGVRWCLIWLRDDGEADR